MQTVTFYAITRTGTSEEYIGSSINLRGRWKAHRYQLRSNTHHCAALQSAWKMYGEAAFSWTVLEVRKCETLNERAAIELQLIIERGTYNAMTEYVTTDNLEANSNAARALQSATNRSKAANDPEYAGFLKKRGQALTEWNQSPEGRANMAKHTKRRWQDPEERKRLSAGLIARWDDPENHKTHAAKITAAHSTPEMKALHKANTTALWETEEYRSKVVEKAAKKRWGDPEAKARQAEKMRAYHAAKRAKS